MDKFCADIHNNLSITLDNNGISLKPCCWFKGNIRMSDKIWDHEQLLEIRKNNKENLLDPVGCSQCIYMESNGGESRRIGVNSYYNSRNVDLPGPRGLDISIDYTCNLACVYCDPAISTQWRIELNIDKKTYPVRLKENDITEILDKINLDNLDNIHFYGGDPFLTRTHEIVLDYINRRVGLEKLYVWYHTNGTTRVPPRVYELWSKCKLVKIFFSIDDIGKRFDYLRYGASWNQVEDNMMWYKETCPVNVMFTVQPTLSCLNSFYHYELLNWKELNFDTNRLGDFVDITRHNVFGKFKMTAIPGELMEKCLENNKNDKWFVEFAKSFKYDPEAMDWAKKELKTLDQRRNQNFATVFPEIACYFGY